LARRSLKPQLNQIRTWARQGRTDAWIAHQLEVSVSDIRGFKRDHGLSEPNGDGEPGPPGAGTEEELDLRAEDDALVAAALEEEADEGGTVDSGQSTEAQDEAAPESAEDDEAPKPRRRGRRGGRGRGRGGKARALEGTFDHGDEGYGLWLDPAVQDDPVYAEHWAGHRPVTVTVEAERIVIRRAGEEDSGDDES
jgi:DNA-binding protein H-NS